MSDLALRLVKARASRGWSQQELADASGVAAAQIYRYESGRSAPRAEVTSRLAKALETPFEWLMYGDGPATVADAAPGSAAAQYVHELEFNEATVSAIDELARQGHSTREVIVREIFVAALEAAIKDPKFRERAAGNLVVLPAAEYARLRKAEQDAAEAKRRVEVLESRPPRYVLLGDPARPADLGLISRFSELPEIPPKPVNRGPQPSPNARKRKP